MSESVRERTAYLARMSFVVQNLELSQLWKEIRCRIHNLFVPLSQG